MDAVKRNINHRLQKVKTLTGLSGLEDDDDDGDDDDDSKSVLVNV